MQLSRNGDSLWFLGRRAEGEADCPIDTVAQHLQTSAVRIHALAAFEMIASLVGQSHAKAKGGVVLGVFKVLIA